MVTSPITNTFLPAAENLSAIAFPEWQIRYLLMDKYRETFETWNKLAGIYQEKFMDLPLYNHTYDALCQMLEKRHPSVLEIGCGPGNITKYLLAKRPDFKILATDIAPAMVEAAQKNNLQARVELMDCREVHRIAEKFDAIVCGFCVPYLSAQDIEKLIADCNHLLNAGGFIYLSFVEGDPGDSGFKSDGQGSRVYFYFHEASDIFNVMNSHNFELCQSFYVPYPNKNGTQDTHTILLARKTNTGK